jgi:hypothetical protein
MKNGQCPKCNSTTIHSQPQGIYYYQITALHLGNTGSMMIPNATVVSYLCTTCGYFENYIADQKILAQVAAKWQKV